MAVKSIVEIELRGGSFDAFVKKFDAYQKALGSSGAAWRMVEQKIDDSAVAFGHLVEHIGAANALVAAEARSQERAERSTRTTADRWKDIARWSRETSGNIGRATLSLLKWASLTGVISGLVGAGGIFGIDRLALGVASSRRSALGLGTTIGGQAAFGANLARLINPDAFLENVAGAKFDVTRRVGLIGAGLSQRQIGGDTTQTALALLDKLKQLADTTNPALFAQVLQARRLDQFASPIDLERLRNTSPEEYARLRQQTLERSKQFDLPADVARRWQDFTTQMSNAGRAIETTLVKGLVGLAPGLSRLSDAVEKTFGSLLRDGGPVQRWLGQLGEGLEKFAGYVGTQEFQTKVVNFVEGVANLAGAVARFGNWLASDTRFGEAGNPSFDVDRQKRVQGKRDTLTNLWNWANTPLGKNITQDQLLGLVRQRENSGDQAVSPKGAEGRYQIMPGTAKQYGFDPTRLKDPIYNEQAARAIIADLARKYHGNVSQVLAAYNAGERGSERYRTTGNAGALPAETQRYIKGTEGMTVRIDDSTGGNAVVSVNGLKQ